MQYIDKSLNYTEGIHITETYLNEECRVTDSITQDVSFCNVDYSGSFSSKPTNGISYKRQMIDVLLRNQSNHCCYCMRRIDSVDDVDVEHIIPQSTRNIDVDYYRTAPGLDKDNIILTSEYVHADNQACPPYPHTVSYNNLVASCYGTFPKLKDDEVIMSNKGCCCNNVRGNAKAYPVYFLSNISELVIYHKHGGIFAKPNTNYTDKVGDVISNAKLGGDSLTSIRQLWYLLKDIPKEEILKCSNDIKARKNLLLTVLHQLQVPIAKKLFNQFEKRDYWNTFLLYDWFHSADWDEV